MKLLLDQNLSFKIVPALADLYPDSAHVRDFGLAEVTDAEVWSHPKNNGFTIVSMDTDFEQRALLLGHPPKVIWLRVGNCPTSEVIALLRTRHADVLAFGSDHDKSFLVLAQR